LIPSTRERAFAVAAVRALGSRAEAVCARRSPDLRRFAALLSRDPERLTLEAARLGHAIPDGITDVHPSWYDAPLASRKSGAAAWLARRTFGHLVDMTRPEADPSDPGDQLERRSGGELALLIVALGRRRVAVAFSGAPRGALAQLCARLGEPAGSELVDEVRHIAQLVLPADVTAAQEAMHRASPNDDDKLDLFTRTGVAWLAPALASPTSGDRLQRVAQKLPRPLGEALLTAGGAPDPGVLSVALSLLSRGAV
jgi:hypothetical protein